MSSNPQRRVHDLVGETVRAAAEARFSSAAQGDRLTAEALDRFVQDLCAAEGHLIRPPDGVALH